MDIRYAMLSQPMAGKTDEEIIVTRERAINALRDRGFEVVNTLFTDEWYSKEAMKKRGVVQVPLCFLAKSLENMSLCHAAYFCKGWENARGCRIEHEAAKAYGLEIIYEEPAGADDTELKKVTLEYSDGTAKDLDKCCVFHFSQVANAPDKLNITADMLSMTGRDLYHIVDAALHLGQRLGMFGSTEVEDCECDCD